MGKKFESVIWALNVGLDCLIDEITHLIKLEVFTWLTSKKHSTPLLLPITADHSRSDPNKWSQNGLEDDEVIRRLNCPEYGAKLALSWIRYHFSYCCAKSFLYCFSTAAVVLQYILIRKFSVTMNCEWRRVNSITLYQYETNQITKEL